MRWYSRYGRELPWRKTTDPHHILISEIMLNQTTVKTVIPVYQEFLKVFPTIESVAQAPLSEVKELTDPLGYKVRGQWIHAIAQTVVNQYNGTFPNSLDELLQLPGVGRYTAGAILSFAFGQDAPIVDTNVERLVGRYFGVNYKTPGAEIRHQLWALAQAVIPQGQGAVFNQALMDMGALVCTARRPTCLTCPIAHGCQQIGLDVGMAAEGRAAYQPVSYRPSQTPKEDV